MADTPMQKYVVNFTFDGGQHGEVIEAPPKLVADWEAAGFISPLDDDGNRIIALGRRAAAETDE